MECRYAAVAVLVALAGCIGGVPSSTPGTTTEDAGPGNPWQQSTLTVGVDDAAASDRNVTRFVVDAVEYWNDHAAEYADYEVTFRVRPDAADPDVRVVFTRDLPRCGSAADGDLLGCAPLVERFDDPPETARIEVTAGYDAETTRRVLQHEFGHVLGLGHDDPPRSLMDDTLNATHLPMPNATALPLPWRSPNVSVYVAAASPAQVRQVRHALAYFERGADGTLDETPRFRLVDDPTAADVTVRVVPDPLSTDDLDEPGSVGHVYGEDLDGDGALEYHTGARVTVAGVGSDAVGWHVAYWLTTALGYERSELPPPLVDADADDRRSEWWRDAGPRGADPTARGDGPGPS